MFVSFIKKNESFLLLEFYCGLYKAVYVRVGVLVNEVIKISTMDTNEYL